MLITTQISDFIGFILIGILLSIIFDFFRTYRMIKKVSTLNVIIQDIIYFFISMFVIAKGIIYILNSSMRFYIFLAIILGFSIYYLFFSKYIIRMYKFLFSTSKKTFDFILLPFYINLHYFVKVCIFMKKIIKKCCKKFLHMLPFKYKAKKGSKKPFKIRIKKLGTKEVKV